MKFNENKELYSIDESYYYVYEHWLDGKIIYVGKGSGNRAFSKLRGDSWRKVTSGRESEVEVVIKGYFKSEKEAFDFEEMVIVGLIHKGIDLANVDHNPYKKATVKKASQITLIKEIVERLTCPIKASNLNLVDNNKNKMKSKTLSGDLQFNSNTGAIDIVNSFTSKNSSEKVIFICGESTVNSNIIESRLESSNKNLRVLHISGSNSKINKISEYELTKIKELLDTGVIPEPYNVLLIPASLISRLNILDEQIGLTVLNTVSKEDRIYVALKFRHISGCLSFKLMDNEVSYSDVIVPEDYIEKPLTSEDKTSLCIRLDIIDARGRVSKWPTVKSLLERLDYTFEESTVTQEGKKVRVTTIYKPEDLIESKS